MVIRIQIMQIVFALWCLLAPLALCRQTEDHTLLTLPVVVKDLRASKVGLTVLTDAGFWGPIKPEIAELEHQLSKAKRYYQQSVSPNGRVFTLNPTTTSSIRLSESSFNGELNPIFEMPLQSRSINRLISNQDGSKVWWLSEGVAKRINTIKKEHELTVQSKEIEMIGYNQYTAFDDRLFLAKPFHNEDIGWQLSVFQPSTDEFELVRTFENTVVLRLEAHASKGLVFSGRDEFHTPDFGFLCLLDGKSLEIVWKNESLKPFHFCLSDDYVILTEGHGLKVVSLANGGVVKEVNFGKQEIYRVTSESGKVWALGNDRRTIYQFDDLFTFLQSK